MLGALKHHVLEQVGESGFALALVSGSNTVPEIDRDDRGRGVVGEVDPKTGYRVPPTYDSLISKLIVSAPTREAALARMARALDEYRIEGIKTTLPLHAEIVRNAFFRKGDYDTGFLDEYFSV